MTRWAVDLGQLRVALGKLKRGQLLIIAHRAVELVAPSKLEALMGDMLSPRRFAKTDGEAPAKSLLAQVQEFHAASVEGKYVDSFAVNWRNCTEKSEGTEEFIAEFDRLMNLCVRAAAKPPRAEVREAFGLLFDLLRRIDDEPDEIVFFADEAGSWQVSVDWRKAVPAYFRCLADGLRSDDFAKEVDRTIEDFVHFDRPHHLAEAGRMANPEQKEALRQLPINKSRR